ncbi:MAG: hypothetical protein ACE5IR_14315 [bacterium]
MNGLEKLHTKYMQDPIPVRLGGLAANLSRVASFSKHVRQREAVSEMLEESKWFIEWTATDAE